MVKKGCGVEFKMNEYAEKVSKFSILIGCNNGILFISSLMVFVYSGYLYAHIVLSILLYVFMIKSIWDCYMQIKAKHIRRIVDISSIVMLIFPLVQYGNNMLGVYLGRFWIDQKDISIIRVILQVLLLLLFMFLLAIEKEKGTRRILIILGVACVLTILATWNINVRPFSKVLTMKSHTDIGLGMILYQVYISIGHILVGYGFKNKHI